MWNNDANLGPFRYILVILRRVVWVSVGCGAWAPSGRELYLTQRRRRAGGRTLIPFSPWGPKLPSHMQSRRELNRSPRAQLPWEMAFQPLNLHSKHCFFSWYILRKPTFLYSQGAQTEIFTACVTQRQLLHALPQAPCKPGCGAGAPPGQPWAKRCLSIMLVSHG